MRSLSYLGKSVWGRAGSASFQAEASKIVRELFCLPLAIDQAGAYIASGATTIGDYLAKYFEHRKMLMSYSEFPGASKYNKTVYETWELLYKEIQQRAESINFHKANAANNAMVLLELFPFFHHEGITKQIFSYAALQKDQKTSNPELPLARSILDWRLLPLNKLGTWDNLLFGEGIWVLLSFSLIKKGSSDGVYAMHPLVHAWGRDRMTLDEKKKCCKRACVTLSCSLRWSEIQSYGFKRALVTHVRANMECSRSENNESIVSYLDDASENFLLLLWEQGYLKEAETLGIQVLDTRKKVLGVEHPDTIRTMGNLAGTYQCLGKYTEAEKLEIQALDATNRVLGVEHADTIRAMGNLATTYQQLGKYTEAEKLEIQVLDARNRILGREHAGTIRAMASLALTYRSLAKYTEAEKLEIQAYEIKNRVSRAESPHTITTMDNVQEAQGIQVLDAGSTVPGEENLDLTQVVLNHPI